MEEHDCLECLEYRQHYWIETHGLYCGPFETGWDEWWQCAACGKEFTAKELDLLVENGGNQTMTRSNDVCKSYTIYAADGRTLTLSETPDRLSIEITISCPNDTLLSDRRTIRLTRAQFKEMSDLDGYNGLAVEDAPEPEAEPEEEDEDVTVA